MYIVGKFKCGGGGVICYVCVKSLNDFKFLFVFYINLYKVNE